MREHVKDPAKKIIKKGDYDYLILNQHESRHLPKERRIHKFRSSRYIEIDHSTLVSEFIDAMKIDFEDNILPSIENLKTVADWKLFCEKEYWPKKLQSI